MGGDEKEILISKLSLVVRNDGRRERERKGRGREGKVSRKATGSVSGFFNLWKTCRCLKGGRKEVLAEERVKMMDRIEQGWVPGHR